MRELLEPLLSNPVLTLFVLIGAGLLLGNVAVKGISLGTSGVLFAALLAGYWGGTVPASVGQIGLVLFVYCVGIGAGGRFFSALQRQGNQLALLAMAVVGSGIVTTWGLAELLALPAGMATGLFAGAMTSTPALAAAIEGSGALADGVVVGYGIAYPFGVIGVVLFVQLLPRLLGKDLQTEEGEEPEEAVRVERKLVEVTNENLAGKRLEESALAQLGGCQIPRIRRNGELVPVQYEDRFELGQEVLLVGEPGPVEIATEMIGRPVGKGVVVNADDERMRMVVTNREITKRPLRELDLLRRHGIVITRISRMEFEFVPGGETRLEPNDIVTVVGPQERIHAFEKVVGHRAHAFSQTSLVSLAIGMSLGILIGLIEFPLPGGEVFRLGLAGGPLLVALALGHFGRMGGLVGHIPRPTRVLLQEMGLVFFLADAGTRGGAAMGPALAEQGVALFGVGAVVTLVPLVVGFVLARQLLRMSLLPSLGGICGGMTSTPALGAITAKTDRQSPIVSYATVYPLAVVFMALAAKVLLALV